ncbi:IS91 family transposase [Rhodopirellula baltica]|uniref:Transposase n=1 Tax=Rhodopirellula baltica (strain DSM 10527 / NCIMB 13988 / SH1) TaxID=243090 RepID=Q7UY21_RHOBA|nr:IS91 family transposase [Rhodopirellula baltica]CAD71828.1 transposase [Rhodopirellula baltica SH 1]
MKGVSMVLKRYGDQYIAKHGTRMTAQQKKVLRAVMACREDSLGTIQYACSGCGEVTHVPRSCCNRHCPACQHQRQQQWLASVQENLLPCQYFLITFTLPAGLREFAMAHPKVLYVAMMSAAAQALQQAATNPRHVGVSETGFTSVLHTWGRDLGYHPHVHVVVPAGGIDAGGVWQSSRASLFVPEQILERLFRGKLKDKLRSESYFDSIPDDAWKGRFVVDSEAVGSGEFAVAYLAPYVMRGAVANRRVTQCDESTSLEEASLTLQVKRSGTRQYKPMQMRVEEFIRRWLQHVLPAGFHRVRHYGFANARSKRSLEEVRWLVAVSLERQYELACSQQIVMAEPVAMQCPNCGGPMINLGYTPATTTLPQPARAPP